MRAIHLGYVNAFVCESIS